MDIDPNLAAMTARLAELAVTNASSVIYTKVQAITSGKIDQRTVNELREIIDELLAERNSLVSIARAYEEQLISQRISDQQIAYITNNVIPVLKDVAEKTAAAGDPAAAQITEQALDILERLLSVEMLTVLQLVGFNFKRAIGEPLTLLLQQFIMSQMRPDPQTIMETNRHLAEANLEMLKIAQDEQATERLQQVLAVWRGTGDDH